MLNVFLSIYLNYFGSFNVPSLIPFLPPPKNGGERILSDEAFCVITI